MISHRNLSLLLHSGKRKKNAKVGLYASAGTNGSDIDGAHVLQSATVPTTSGYVLRVLRLPQQSFVNSWHMSLQSLIGGFLSIN